MKSKSALKLTKTQKFRESQLPLKNKILSFARLPRLSFTSTFRKVMIWCALDSTGQGQSFKYLECYPISRRKNFRGIWKKSFSSKFTFFFELEISEKCEFWAEIFFFFQMPLKFFLRVLWHHSRYLKGALNIALYTGKKIRNARHTKLIISKEM